MSKKETAVARSAPKRTSSPSHTRARIAGSSGSPAVAVKESSGELISHILQVSRKSGIKREAIFKNGSPKRIYAYYVLPSDPSKMVREDAEGKKSVGTVTNGKFRVLRSITR